MPFDGFFIRTLVNELDPELREARIERIHQPEKHDLVLNLRRKNGNCRLLVSANARWARFHLTADKQENPSAPPAFCMLLRKYLEGARITRLEQPGWERIIKIHLLALNEFRDWSERVLIGEFMGRHSNIILIDPETNTIIDAIKRYGSDVSSYREVLPGRPYLAPPAQNKMLPEEVVPETLWARWWPEQEGKGVAAALFSVVEGLSLTSAAYVCQRAGIDPLLTVEECGDYELNRLYSALKELVSQIEAGRLVPGLVASKPPSDFWLLPLAEPWQETETVNQTADRYFTARLRSARLESIKTNLNRNLRSYLDRLYRKRQLQEHDLARAHENDRYRVWGELLTAYAHEVPRGASQVTLTDFYSGEPVTIELQPHLSAIDNAQKYFRIYAKAKGARDHLQVFLADTRAEIEYLESVQVALERAETLDEAEEIIDELTEQGYVKENRKNKRRAHGETGFRQFVSSDGYQILVGRNNRQNDLLTMKKAAPGDLWLHAKETPGTHVIVRLPGGGGNMDQIPDRTLTEAALLAAYYSKAREGGKVDVDYTFRSQVKKPRAARPGMVIYEGYWTITVDLASPFLTPLLN